MALPRLTTDLDVIQKLDNEPNDVGGLSADELKAKFDEAPNAVKTWLNDVLLPFLEGTNAAKNIGVDTIDGLDTATNVQDAIAGAIGLIQQATEGQVLDGSITTAKLAALAVTTAKIDAGAVTDAKLADGAVVDGKVGAAAVGTTNLKDSAVTTAKLADGAVTASKLAEGAITGAAIGAGSVNSEKLGQYAVTTEKIAGTAVTAEKIAPNAVSTKHNGQLTVAGWTGSAAPYTQAVTVTGVLATDEPMVDLIPSDTYATAALEDSQWGQIYKAVATANTITFYAKAKPSVALNFKARCIRK